MERRVGFKLMVETYFYFFVRNFSTPATPAGKKNGWFEIDGGNIFFISWSEIGQISLPPLPPLKKKVYPKKLLMLSTIDRSIIKH